jgi:hypothetical protein
MTALIQDEEASGWDPELKGFYNIEMRNGVTQASPLTILSAALLSRNETLYKTRSLPTIAYLLSRKWAHFGRPYEIGDWSGKVHAHPPYGTGSLGQRKKFFGTPVWQGLDALTEGLNPWLEAYVLPDGNVYHGDSNMQSAPHWSAMLAAYRYNPSDALLAEIQRKADDYIENNPYERATEPVPITTFYEVGTYPYWKDLIDLYELTGESRYLEAAATYGTISIAGHWAHPPVTDDSVIIHPDGKVDADTRILWKNEKWYRLGTQQHLWLEDKSGRQWLKYFEVPEAKVPASEVSRVGLGFETPGTLVFPGFIRGDQGLKNILMSANAPDLLRVAHRTGDPIFKTYARNMTIGRFTNYPGYYYTAYSNLPQNPDYPIEGPDLSRFYYHHIPVHLAFTMDYLMAQAELRSDDQIAFPWVKQQGYVWFANRVYGLMPGSVFGEKNLRLRMDRNLVHNTRPNVDWFIAESDDQVVLVAMSQSDSVIHFRPDLNAERLSLDLSSGARVHHANGGVWETTDEPMPRVEIAPKGMVAFAFARSSKAPTAEAVNTLSEAPKSIELGEALGGELKVFRIRSPLFEDGIYVHLSEGARDTLKVTFHLKGKSPLHRDRYPYEAIFYPIDRADNALLKVTIDNIDSGKTKSVEVPVGH